MSAAIIPAFLALTGRVPTDAEKLRLYKLKDALKVEETDAIWSILIALDYHRSLYEAIPEKIESLSKAAHAAATEETKKIQADSLAVVARGKTDAQKVQADAEFTLKRAHAGAVAEVASESRRILSAMKDEMASASAQAVEDRTRCSSWQWFLAGAMAVLIALMGGILLESRYHIVGEPARSVRGR